MEPEPDTFVADFVIRMLGALVAAAGVFAFFGGMSYFGLSGIELFAAMFGAIVAFGSGVFVAAKGVERGPLASQNRRSGAGYVVKGVGVAVLGVVMLVVLAYLSMES